MNLFNSMNSFVYKSACEHHANKKYKTVIFTPELDQYIKVISYFLKKRKLKPLLAACNSAWSIFNTRTCVVVDEYDNATLNNYETINTLGIKMFTTEEFFRFVEEQQKDKVKKISKNMDNDLSDIEKLITENEKI